MWRRIRAETGFHDLRIHDLRRTVGSWLARDGASLHLVGAVLNHKDQKTTAGYAYFQTKDRQRVLDRHGRKIVQIANGGTRRRAKYKVVVDAPSEGQPRKLPRVHQISRKELYNLIWPTPITALAERFGISDKGLTKVCRRSDIPAPPREYWAHIEAEGAFHRPELPNLAEENTNGFDGLRDCQSNFRPKDSDGTQNSDESMHFTY
jgi:Phage integrase family